MGIYCFKSDRFRFLYFLVYEVYTKSNVRIQFCDFRSRLNWPKFQSWAVLNNLSEDTDGAAVWRHHRENLVIKLPLLKIILLRVHSWLKKMLFLHFPFLPLQRIEVFSRVLGEPLMLLLSFKMEIPRKKLENRTFENILGGSH